MNVILQLYLIKSGQLELPKTFIQLGYNLVQERVVLFTDAQRDECSSMVLVLEYLNAVEGDQVSGMGQREGIKIDPQQ